MIRFVKGGIPYLLLFFMLLSWGMALAAYMQLSDIPNTAVIHLQDAEITAQRVQQIRKTWEGASFTAWAQADNQLVKTPELGRSAFVDVITIEGSADLLFPIPVPFFSSDKQGCLLDEKTASDLGFSFDTAFVAGILDEATGLPRENKIVYHGQTYLIRGTFPAPASTMILAPKDNQTAFSKISIAELPDQTVSQTAEGFGMANGLTYQKIITNKVYNGLAVLFVYGVPLILGVFIALMLQKATLKKREYPILFGLYLLLSAAVLCLYLWLIDLNIVMPDSFVPTKWSDFEFWERLAHQLQEDTQYLLTMKRDKPDLLAGGLFLKSLGFGMIGALLTCSLKKIPVASIQRLFFTVLICLVLSFVSVLYTGISAGMLWSVVPFYFVIKKITDT